MLSRGYDEDLTSQRIYYSSLMEAINVSCTTMLQIQHSAMVLALTWKIKIQIKTYFYILRNAGFWKILFEDYKLAFSKELTWRNCAPSSSPRHASSATQSQMYVNVITHRSLWKYILDLIWSVLAVIEKECFLGNVFIRWSQRVVSS